MIKIDICTRWGELTEVELNFKTNKEALCHIATELNSEKSYIVLGNYVLEACEIAGAEVHEEKEGKLLHLVQKASDEEIDGPELIA